MFYMATSKVCIRPKASERKRRLVDDPPRSSTLPSIRMSSSHTRSRPVVASGLRAPALLLCMHLHLMFTLDLHLLVSVHLHLLLMPARFTPNKQRFRQLFCLIFLSALMMTAERPMRSFPQRPRL